MIVTLGDIGALQHVFCAKRLDQLGRSQWETKPIGQRCDNHLGDILCRKMGDSLQQVCFTKKD